MQLHPEMLLCRSFSRAGRRHVSFAAFPCMENPPDVKRRGIADLPATRVRKWITEGLQLDALRQLRHELHKHPTLSDFEGETAQTIDDLLEPLADRVVHLGHGRAFVFGATQPEPDALAEREPPCVWLRAELDALPIQEATSLDYASVVPGVSHMCGHDGHMSILVGVARLLTRSWVERRGTVVLLFQPAEETGHGSARVLGNPALPFVPPPDFVFALHNTPQLPLGHVAVKSGVFACASRGVIISLQGRSAHASQPQHGCAPTQAVASIIAQLDKLRSAPSDSTYVLTTVTHVSLGQRSFGVAPAHAVIYATLRTESDEAMQELLARVQDISARACESEGAGELTFSLEQDDVFPACVNNPRATEVIQRAAPVANCALVTMSRAFRWSEDVGRFFTQEGVAGALFALGSGGSLPPCAEASADTPWDPCTPFEVKTPSACDMARCPLHAGSAGQVAAGLFPTDAQLHNPHYDFPNAALEQGVGMFAVILAHTGSVFIPTLKEE